jgi:DNA replication initiation complex subunit (GINS family)
VEWAREVEKGNTEAAKRLADILTIRMMKIVALAAKRLDGEVVRKLTPEEEALYREVYTTVDKWNKSFREAGI